MKTALTALAERSGKGVRLPSLAGVGMVFRHQLRGRRAGRDLLWAVLLLATQAGMAYLLRGLWPTAAPSNETQGFLLGSLALCLVSGVALLLPCAAALGAKAVPTPAEFENTQSALLTRLTAFDLVAGRLLAELWPLLSATLAGCAFWLAAQLGWRFLPDGGAGYGTILLTHLTLLAAVGMVGAVGFLFAERRRPGRSWGLGATIALAWAAFCVTAILLIDPLLLRLAKPGWLIEVALLLNPVAAAVTAPGLEFDALREPWLYDHSHAPEFAFAYPPVWKTAGLFLLLSLCVQAAAAARLRRAYR